MLAGVAARVDRMRNRPASYQGGFCPYLFPLRRSLAAAFRRIFFAWRLAALRDAARAWTEARLDLAGAASIAGNAEDKTKAASTVPRINFLIAMRR